jgi:hypothetical protein
MKYTLRNGIRQLITFVFLLPCLITVAQTELPKIIPASPVAQTFMRYGEIPIDYSTGVPSIEIPIYTIAGKQLNVPISISYHASGIKVLDIASEVGLGWALNCGGLVSRTVQGIRDEAQASTRTYSSAQGILNAFNDPYYYSYNSGTFEGLTDMEYFLQQRFDNEQDYMSDRYFYKLPNGSSGIFRYNFNNIINDENSIVTLPYKPYKIKKIVSGANPDKKIDRFEITDDNGTLYVFKAYISNMPVTCSEWFLAEIISADGAETITFNYVLQAQSAAIHSYSGVYTSSSSPTNLGDCNNGNPYPSTYSEPISQNPVFKTPILESIVSKDAIVKFYYGARDDFSDLKRLTKVTVSPLATPENVIRNIDFVARYFGTTAEDKRLGLEKVVFGTSDNELQQTYSFAYESQVLPGYPEKMSARRYNEDFWGYYNGSNATSLVEQDFISNVYDKQAYGGDRDPDASGYFAKACMLREIRYPTGGHTKFEFERHSPGLNIYTYKSVQNAVIGGFRVKRITNYLNDNNDIANMKTYLYEEPVAEPITEAHFKVNQQYLDLTNGCRIRYFRDVVYSSPFVPLEVAPGMPIMYKKVTEFNGTEAQHAGKTVFTYEDPYTSAGFHTNNPEGHEFLFPRYCNPFHYDKGNYTPKLISKTIYSFDGSAYHPIEKELNAYSTLFSTTYNTGIKLTRAGIYNTPYFYNGIWCGGGLQDCSVIFNEHKLTIDVRDTKAYQEVSFLTNAKKYTFDPKNENNYTFTSTDLAYNQSNLAISQQTVLDSHGDQQISVYKYPADFSGQQPYANMVNVNHLLSPVVEKLDYKNNTSIFLQSTKTDFSFWNGGSPTSNATNKIYPLLVSTKKAGGSYEPRLQYEHYDEEGNLTAVSKSNGSPTVYIWSYNKSLPVARVDGAKVNEVYSNNFEEGTDFPTGVSLAANFANTGRYSGKIVNGNSGELVYHSNSWLSVDLNNQPKRFHYSGWVYSDGPSAELFLFMKRANETGYFSYVDSRVTYQVGSWVLLEGDVMVPADVAFLNLRLDNNSTGTVWFDDLRIFPSEADMTTFTYDPLVGITSQLDGKNLAQHYEYDKLNRLQYIRDGKRNLLKAFCYNYLGQQANCFTVNTPETQVYARIEISNYQNMSSITPNGDINWTTGDVIVKFYSDPSCTAPYTLPAATAIAVSTTNDNNYDGSSTTSTSNSQYTVPAGSSSYSIGNLYQSYSESWNDGGTYHYGYITYTYTLLAQTGSNYTPKPTLQ